MTTSKKSRASTAGEFIAGLKADPEYRSRQLRLQVEREAHRFEYRRKAHELLTALGRAGYAVRSVGELLLSSQPYRSAIPILIDWLGKTDDLAVKGDIVQTLSVPWAKPEVVQPLVDEFRRCNDENVRWAVSSGLVTLADDSLFEVIADLARDRSFGRGRLLVVLALGKMKKTPQAVDVLLSQLEDRDVAIAAIEALGNLKAKGARSAIDKFSKDSDADFRREAKKAIAKIDKAR
jgi:hypothetical protein